MSSGEREDDAVATIRLRKRLSRRGLKRYRITGSSTDWNHQEASFATWNLTLEEAMEIGREFQQNAVFWIDSGRIEVVSCENGERKFVGNWKERFRLWSEKPTCRIYVIRLDPEVRKAKRFRGANPSAHEDAECLYVGMTACSAEERFKQHKQGYKACSFVRKHGLSLVPELFPETELLPLNKAYQLEIEHAESLRKQGYSVWQR
jgi:predicted GIY-YIG superfamily endonuclease